MADREFAAAHWYLSLLAVGAASTAVEIAGLRLLAPIFGTSLPIWGSVIAAVLAGFAVGYTLGGKRSQDKVTATTVFSQAAWGAALFLTLPFLYRIIDDLSDSSYPIAFLLSLVVLLIPSVIFGMVSPLAVQAEAARRKEPAGQVAGRISTLTTLGSLIGILVPSFLTIPILGTRATVWIFAGIVLALSLPIVFRTKYKKANLLLLVVAGVLGSMVPYRVDPAVIYADETKHQYITVHQGGDQRWLVYDAGWGVQSLLPSGDYTNGYWDYLAALPALLPTDKNELSVLVLGAAASATERQMERFWKNSKDISFTSVDIDADVFAVADKYFDPPARTTINSDARLFAATNNSSYDLIIVDVYAREMTVPFHLATQEFFSSLQALLTDDGMVAVNINSNSPNSLWLRSITTTAHSVFPQVKLVSVPSSCNYLLIAGDYRPTVDKDVPPKVAALLPAFDQTQTPQTDGLLMTDDRSPTDLLGLAALIYRTNESLCA